MTGRIVLVSGTDTEIGKTVVTAALAAAHHQAGEHVVVLKPTQTGLQPGEEGDVQQVARLVGLDEVDAVEGIRLPEPLAPTTAGRRAGVPLPSVAEQARHIIELAERADLVLVESAGGILVGMDDQGRCMLDLADCLRDAGVQAPFVVVARPDLGTLNHTGLTCAAIRDRGHQVIGVVVGSLPAEPDLAMRCNLEELAQAAGAPLVACLPAGLGSLTHGQFESHVGQANLRALAALG